MVLPTGGLSTYSHILYSNLPKSVVCNHFPFAGTKFLRDHTLLSVSTEKRLFGITLGDGRGRVGFGLGGIGRIILLRVRCPRQIL